ncbi:carboxypeptidase regulatory-like domain-containing protein [Geomonas subterranea]|uniref:Carboxypeptidase regulatory-like domain-containing protein n=1 Tax=Geomonas subterranea TaxID=2847989 RepID=A0ABX8LM34_9BACT|nr:carboxypeptidase regulatory-like domain-containing protein [Geomonas subterranea]QXE92947.1 carboxypeptidase regulatory-like domain-containing protein [Geomonas subterranea]QXM08947.1 carboxypeptidase regulatory-like domain-containing protein [Geomonas subterranea]
MIKLLKLAVAVLFFLLHVAGAHPAPAAQQASPPKATGAIAGRVTDEGGNPIYGADAEAYPCAADDTLAGSAVTDRLGEYQIKGLAGGCYRVRFSGNDLESSWHGGKQLKDDCSEVTVGGDKVQGIDGKLSEAGAVVTGRVTSTEGAPLSGAWVTVIQNSGTEQGPSVSDGRSDEKGVFSVRILPGKCIVLFSRKGYVTTLHGKSATEPAVVDTAKGKTAAGINGVLAKGGRITGTLTDGSRALPGIYAVAYASDMKVLPVYARSDSTGRFVLDGLASGKYRIAFGDREQKFLLQWHDGKTDPEEATIITVTAPGTVSGIKGVLRQSGGIAGMVTDESGKAVPEVLVIAEGVDRTARGGSAITDQTGSYAIRGLDSAPYHLSFRATSSQHLPVYYRDAAKKESAQVVEVAAPDMVLGVNQVLRQGVLLTGKVTNSAGEPVQAAVMAYRAGEKEGDDGAGYGSSQPDGTFSMAVADGSYLVEVRAPGYLPQWSGKAATRDEALPVAVSRGEGSQPLEVVLERGASISGTVKDRTGAGIPRVRVSARDGATGERGESAVTEEGGKFTISGLKSGSYRLKADGTEQGYMEWKLPQPVQVTAPGGADNVSIVLAPGGAVSGRVTDPAGAPLTSVSVAAYDPATWDEMGSAYTGLSGEYKIGGLPEGSYAIRFEKSDSKYPVQWHKGKYRREDSARVEVIGTATASGIDAVLQPGVSLTGTVTDSGGAPLANAKIEVYGANEDEPFSDTRTDYRGSFTIASLAPGSYRLLFSHSDHVSRWYGGNDRRNATRLAVKEGGVPPLSVALAPAKGKFSGKLMNPEGKKIGQAWLTAIDALSGAAVADERICECSGEFHTPVPGGMYRLRVERHGQVTWYGGNTQEEAQQLPAAGEISGLELVIDDKGVRGKQSQRN